MHRHSKGLLQRLRAETRRADSAERGRAAAQRGADRLRVLADERGEVIQRLRQTVAQLSQELAATRGGAAERALGAQQTALELAREQESRDRVDSEVADHV